MTDRENLALLDDEAIVERSVPPFCALHSISH